jgi:AcrR family transcriptional regulator/DNA-binding MarR family transcriptional regulator
MRSAIAVAKELPREQVAEIQRSRLLAAAFGAVEEQGYEGATVAHITNRARVSRRTFYELFANREECIAAALYDVAALLERELRTADLAGLAWRERIRQGLWLILCFLERDPTLAGVLIVHSQRGGSAVLEAREAIVARLVAAVDEGRRERACLAGCSELTAEGVLGAALAILHARLTRPAATGPQLSDLLGELSAIVLLPYLGAAVAGRERARPAPAPPRHLPPARQAPLVAHDPLAELPMRVTYRTAKVLEGVGAYPRASNREIAEHAGIADPGQVSKLLARLERLGLLENEGAGQARGEPNAWRLTATGVAVARAITAHLRTTARERVA